MNLQQYFPGLELDAPVEIREVELNNKTTLAALISSSGLSRDEFLGWNPALTPTSRIVPAGYRMKLPMDRGTPPLVTVAQVQQAARQPQVQQATRRPQAQVVHHRVQRGETLYDIARRYGASVENLLQVNGLRKAHLLKVGTTLRIPKI